jgi:hypothetical protein
MADQNTQEVVEAPEVLNRQLLDAIVQAPEGHLKNASVAGSEMIRRRLRENGFTRLIIPHKPAADSDLNQLPHTELPVIIEEMEPDSPGAQAITFNDTADTAFYRGDKFVVYFAKITTPEFTKNVDELRTYKHDLRAVITDNSLKDIHTLEDSRFINTINRMVGTANTANGAAGVIQNVSITSDITRAQYTLPLSHLENRSLNNGCFLMNRRTAKKFLTFDRDDIGGDLAESLFKDGLKALQEAVIFGVRHIFTIKRDQVPDGVLYQFTEPGFLGKAYELQPVTMYVEKKKDILRFSAMEKIGITIANVAGVNRTYFSSFSG